MNIPIKLVHLFIAALAFLLIFVYTCASATEVTVCDTGCTYTTVTDALNALPLMDSYKITTITDVIVVNPFGSNRSLSYSIKPSPVIDTTPDAFTFIPQIGIAPNANVISNSITITGINSPAIISITTGLYSINNNTAFTNAPGKVSNGSSVKVKRAASAVSGKTLTSTLTVGGVSGIFSVTTK